MYSISICDADRSMRDSLESILKSYFAAKDIEVHIRKFSSGDEMSRYKGPTDIAFLDVEMGTINGIQIGYTLMCQNAEVFIFIVTTHYRYLDDAMDLKVFRYLNKPVDKGRLYSALDIITEQSRDITFLSNRIEVTLKEREVACIYSYARRTYVLTDSGVSYPTTMSIKQWLDKLQGCSDYSHPHYSYIINLKFVTRVNGRVITLKCKNGMTMDIVASQRKATEFRNDYYSRLRNLP